MASTNKTTNLSLSQFIATDKPSWLSDYNADMTKIDAGYGKAISDSKSAVSGAASASAAAQAAQTTANSAKTSSVNNASNIAKINNKLTFAPVSAPRNTDNTSSGYTILMCSELMGSVKCRLTFASPPTSVVVSDSNSVTTIFSAVGNIFKLPIGSATQNRFALGSGLIKTDDNEIIFAQCFAFYDGANTNFVCDIPTTNLNNVSEICLNTPFFMSGQIIDVE